MSDSTQVQASRAITVRFHGAELYVVEHNGQPYTPMKPIVSAIGLDWASQFRKVASNETRWGIVNLTTPSAGGEQEMTCLPVRKMAAWLTTIEPGKVKNPDVRARVIQYQNECDDALWQYWNEGMAVNPRAFSMHSGQTLLAEQAYELRCLVEGWAKKLSVDTKVQGKFILQAWSKLKSHFKVGYRQIPQECLHEALSIVGRHAADWEVVDDEPAPAMNLDDAVRLDLAFSMSAQAGAQVQRSVFASVMQGDADWTCKRYISNLTYDRMTNQLTAPATRVMDHGEMVTTLDKLPDWINGNDPIFASDEQLANIATACTMRLSRSAANRRPNLGQ